MAQIQFSLIKKTWTSRTIATLQPLRLITSHFCLTLPPAKWTSYVYHLLTCSDFLKFPKNVIYINLISSWNVKNDQKQIITGGRIAADSNTLINHVGHHSCMDTDIKHGGTNKSSLSNC